MPMTQLRKPTGEEKMVADTASEIAEEYDRTYLQECAEEGRYPQELWNTFSEVGFTGMNVPEEYGGAEMGMREMATLTETLSRQGISELFLLLSATMAPIALKYHASEATKERFLPRIASGESKFCFAITEPEAGTNSVRMQTLAERDGDQYLVNGEKTFISGAAEADYIQLVCRTTPYEEVRDTNPYDGVSLLMVPTDAPGLTMNSLGLRTGWGLDQYTLYFDDAEVPVENRIGEEGNGFRYMFDALNPERIFGAASAIGSARFVLDRTVDYASERVVFDEPIGAHQGVQHPLARGAMRLETAALANDRAVKAFDNDEEYQHIWSNMANWTATEAADQIMDAAIQTHGGNAFHPDYEIINHLHSTKISKVAPINNNMLLNFIGENLLNLPKSY